MLIRRNLYGMPMIFRAPDGEGAGGAAGEGEGEGQQQQDGEGEGQQAKTPDKATDGDGGSMLDFANKQNGEGDAGGEGEGEGAGDGKGGDGEGEGKQAQTLKFDSRPDWLPANFYDDKTKEVNVEALAKSQQDLRKKLSMGGGKVPESADGYKFDIQDAELKAAQDRVLLDGENDPVLTWFKTAMHENNVPQAVATNVYEGFLRMAAEAMPEPIDPKAEIAALGKNGQNMINHTHGFVQGLVEKGVLTDEEGQSARAWFATADDIRAFDKIRQYYGEKPVPAVLPGTQTGTSAAELRGKMRQLMQKANKGDPNAQREYETLQAEYEKLYGTEPAGTSMVT